MSQSRTHDLKSNLGGATSVKPQAASATVSGGGVDARDLSGPIHALVVTGDASGSPTSFTVDHKLQESSDNSTFTDVVGGAATQHIAANKRDIIRAVRTKRYVRIVSTISFTGGTSPTVQISGEILGQKQTV